MSTLLQESVLFLISSLSVLDNNHLLPYDEVSQPPRRPLLPGLPFSTADVTVCGACQTLDFFADVSFHNVFFCAIFVYSLPKFALMGLSFVLTLILHSRAFKRLFSRVRSNDGKGRSLPPSSGIVMTKKSKKYKKKDGKKAAQLSLND